MRKGSFVPLLLAVCCGALGFAVLRLGSQEILAAQEKHAGAGAPQDWLRGISSGKTVVVDMTYALNGKLPAWPGDERTFEAQNNATPEKDGYFTRSFWMLEHYATHMDAPAHFPPGKETLDKIPDTHFFGPAVVIDVREESSKDADYRLTIARIEKWEAAHGRVPAGAIVMLRTGWASRWPDQTRYRNMDANGVMHFPGYSVESAKLLMERRAVGLGIVESFRGAPRGFACGTLQSREPGQPRRAAGSRSVRDCRANQARRRIGRAGAGVRAAAAEIVLAITAACARWRHSSSRNPPFAAIRCRRAGWRAWR